MGKDMEVCENKDTISEYAKLPKQKMQLKEKLAVQIALKTMRKAHTHGSSTDNERLSNLLRDVLYLQLPNRCFCTSFYCYTEL